jgi:hypothetical protein
MRQKRLIRTMAKEYLPVENRSIVEKVLLIGKRGDFDE